MTPTIYEPKEIDFTHNGLGFLKDCIRCEVLEERNGKYQLELEYPAQTRFSESFDYGYQIKAKPNDQEEYHIFVIKSTYKDTITDSIIIYAQSRTYNLGNREVQQVQINSLNAHAAMKAIESGMDQPSDIVLTSDIQTVSSTIFEAQNVLNCIAGEQGSLLQRWGGEIKREPFKLSLLQKRGRENVGTVRYGKDLAGLKIKFDWESVITKILPYAEVQNSEGVTERIYGTPVLSELVGNYPDVRAAHIQFTEDQGVTDVASLNTIAARYFTSLNPGSDKPKINIELEIENLSDSEEAKEFAKLRNYGLCDTFNVYHEKYDIDIDTKIISVLYDSLLEKTIKLTAGDAQLTFYQKQNYDFQEVIKTLSKKEYMSNFIDYITDLINGVEGGSVLQYPKNRPHSTYYLDADTKEEAKDVIVINNQGIGFSRTGWQGPFIYGWTIDGVLLADFIKAGTLEGILIKGCEFQTISDHAMIRIQDGRIDFINKEDGGTFGSVAPIYQNGADGLMISIDEGDFLSIGMNPTSSASSRPIIEIPRDSTHSNPKLNLIGEVNVVGKLLANGKEVTGGGSGSGIIPPELTTEQEKNAWRVWTWLKAHGYSEEAAAAVLGNMEQESGIMPDKEQIGGPAYGLVQWDGSAYPLVPPATSDGRQYVQNLMAAAGITEDYTTIEAQMQLFEWCMHNGQWIGVVEPLTVAAFKAATNIAQATTAFERNFERPKDTHPERIEMAQRWYDKLKNLSAGSDGWLNPVRTAYSITQEWDEPDYWSGGAAGIHGGIDVASIPKGSKPPIYAAHGGTVIARTFDGLGGNYLVIDHGDGYWSYYGHLESFSVSQGQTVTNADVIGIMGATGEGVTGVHLHFEVWQGSQWNRINPRDVINF